MSQTSSMKNWSVGGIMALECALEDQHIQKLLILGGLQPWTNVLHRICSKEEDISYAVGYFSLKIFWNCTLFIPNWTDMRSLPNCLWCEIGHA